MEIVIVNFIVNFNDIAQHPTLVMSAEYWVNIKAGKLPFNKDKACGEYTAVSHTKDLNTATYLTVEEAIALNIKIWEVRKAKAKLDELKKQMNIE